MSVPFMKAYTELLIKTCHRRGAHAMGGMAAFIPSRRDEEVNREAFAKVREDKELESRNGHDGTRSRSSATMSLRTLPPCSTLPSPAQPSPRAEYA